MFTFYLIENLTASFVTQRIDSRNTVESSEEHSIIIEGRRAARISLAPIRLQLVSRLLNDRIIAVFCLRVTVDLVHECVGMKQNGVESLWARELPSDHVIDAVMIASLLFSLYKQLLRPEQCFFMPCVNLLSTSFV